jgi:integrase
MIKVVLFPISVHCRKEWTRSDGFYLKPLATGFAKQVVGVHTLEKIIPDLMTAGGFTTGKYTLHSLRASCATRLFKHRVEEQLIQEITGHQLSAVRESKRTDDEMKKKVSHLLECSSAVLPKVAVKRSLDSEELLTVDSESSARKV